ncbi:MAG: HD domain-containing protein [Ktedonobacteraceae bacterium]|nr:HD domain-containing protein [Ktedonobacteraceae bacterium]
MEKSFYQVQVLPLIYAEVERRYTGITDLAHGWEHVSRVYALSQYIAEKEGADLFIVGMAALLHDLGHTATPTLSKAAAAPSHHTDDSVILATTIMRRFEIPEEIQPAIVHAILTHSFSRGLEPQTLEAHVLRDADRLDALGALGIMRWSIVGAQRNTGQTRSYNPDDPFAEQRLPDDHMYMLDHFFVKLFKLAGTMTTGTGRSLAQRRTAFMRSYIHELKSELELV